MFCKLALGNARRSFRDYGIYFLTLTFGVCLFYVFNSLETQPVMTFLAQSGHYMAESILLIFDIFSLFVTAVLAALILYANDFLMRRRKRELGLYLVLGMSQGQVGRLLVLETGLAGLLALGSGLGLGLLAAQGLAALAAAMFRVDLRGLTAPFSPGAAARTAGYFAAIFLAVMVLTGVRVGRARLVDLLQSPRRNEPAPRERGRVSAAVLLAGCALLGGAYWLVLTNGILNVNFWFWVMLALGSLGTFCLFRGLTGLGAGLIRRWPALRFRGLNLFTLGQWLSRTRTHCLSATVICLMLLLAIGITASAVGLNQAIEAQSALAVDMAVTIWPEGMEGEETLAQALGERGFRAEEAFSAWADVKIYQNDGGRTGLPEDTPSAMTEGDYRALLSLLEEEAGEVGVPSVVALSPRAQEAAGVGETLAVISGEMAAGLDLRREMLLGNYAGAAETAEEALDRAAEALSMDRSCGIGTISALENYLDLLGTKVLALFLGLYLGIAFLLASAAVLALQQLSQGADNAPRYALLRRLGAPEGLAARSAGQQVALAFLQPLLLAALHAAVGLRAVEEVLGVLNGVDPAAAAASVAAVAVLLTAVYGGYFLATSLACRSLARQETL